MTRAVILATLLIAAQVRTADPVRRGLKESDFPRTIKVSDNVYTYEDFHAGDEKFTTTNMFVVTPAGVLVADGQGDVAATKGLVDAIAKVTPNPIKYVVICSDHGDHTGGNAAFPAGVTYIIHPTSKAILDRQAEGRGGRGGPSWRLPAGAQLVSEKNPLTLGGEDIEILFLGRAHTGGDLGVYRPGSAAPEVEAAILSMKTGMISEPIKTESGYHLIKIISRESPEPSVVQAAREQLRRELGAEKRLKQYADFIAKLRASAAIRTEG